MIALRRRLLRCDVNASNLRLRWLIDAAGLAKQVAAADGCEDGKELDQVASR